ncbi:Metallo-dependent phosphatase-like protein [Phlebopus sp. FC_14]|nr:Metallo-dependent phosphatase-like protein [Phlebopus sp. FC_14]
MILPLLSLVGLAIACDDHQLHARSSHVHEKRLYPQVPLNLPASPLVWGDFNVIHTTDTHGWLLGHQKLSGAEPYYSGDLGDFASFVTHMKQIADEKDVDLLLVDSGDLHDGTGLSEGYPAGGIDGHESDKFLLQLHYDLMTIGNHELENYTITYDMYKNFAPQLNGRYLTSNANITLLLPNGTSLNTPIGNPSVTFTTPRGRKVTSLGVIYDMKGKNATNTTLHTPAQMVTQDWFGRAIAEEPDVFVLLGHMPVDKASWDPVYQAIRDKHTLTPIMILGGHTHIRDCQQYDPRSMALESGRYMETIGANISASKGNSNSVGFSRRYLDQNRVTYEYHTNTSNTTFDTDYGRSITQGLQTLAANFSLGTFYGNAPQDYTFSQVPFGANGSLWSFFIQDVAPTTLKINNTRSQIPNLIITNYGPLRFDIFKGSFTKNDQLTTSPYVDGFSFVPNVTLGVANQLVPAMNNHSGIPPCKAGGSGTLPYGHNTTDSCPGVGDDTLHRNLPDCFPPHYMNSTPPNVPDDTPIDLVFLTHTESVVLANLKKIDPQGTYTPAPYSNITTNEMFGIYAETYWK